MQLFNAFVAEGMQLCTHVKLFLCVPCGR